MELLTNKAFKEMKKEFNEAAKIVKIQKNTINSNNELGKVVYVTVDTMAHYINAGSNVEEYKAINAIADKYSNNYLFNLIVH